MSRSLSPWENIPPGSKAPDVVNIVIEVPRGSQNKYEFDEELGIFKLDRVLYGADHYPLDYGFIPGTRSEDGDHLDALVIGGDPLAIGTVLESRVVGMLHMIDSGEPDAKILAVQEKNPRFEKTKDIKDVEAYSPHLLKEVANFFATYKQLQGKKVEIGAWGDAKEAKQEIEKAMGAYNKEQ